MSKFEEMTRLFEENADSAKVQAMSDYMKNRFSFYGIQTPKRRALYKSFLANEKKSGKLDWAFLKQVWQDDHRECQYLVLDYLRAMEKFLTYDDIEKLEYFIRTKQWWDSIDILAHVIAHIGLDDDRIDDLMRLWAQDGNIWLRRLAILHQLGRKEQTKIDLLQEILLMNLGSKEFFINKAIGWALRDLSKTNAAWVRQFFTTNKKGLSLLSIREASKYL